MSKLLPTIARFIDEFHLVGEEKTWDHRLVETFKGPAGTLRVSKLDDGVLVINYTSSEVDENIENIRTDVLDGMREVIQTELHAYLYINGRLIETPHGSAEYLLERSFKVDL